MVRPRRTLIRLCRCGASAPLLCPTRRMHAESGSSLLSFCENFQTFQPSNFQTILRSIPFRITFFAHPHHLTLTESYSYKEQGRGWGFRNPAPTQSLRTCATRSNARNSNIFIHLLRDSLDTHGVGYRSFSARLRALCASALSFSAIRFFALHDTGRPL